MLKKRNIVELFTLHRLSGRQLRIKEWLKETNYEGQ
jgi:hypothetical protein